MKMRHYNWYYKNKKIRDYCEQRYANKLDNLEKMEKFLETYNLSRLNQEETENVNRLINSKETKSVITSLLMKKILGPDGLTGEFYQTVKN